MNKLQLVNRVRRECGIAGNDLTSLASPTGELARLIDWTDEAWLEIQTAETAWDWMRKAFSFATTTGQFSYTPSQAGISDFASWKIDSCRCYVTAVGAQSEMFLDPIGYDDWRDTYQFSSFRTTYTRPLSVAVTPDKQLALGPGPDATGYTIDGEYYKQPTTMTADADTPDMPDRFHMAIVFKAMKSYALFEAAPEVLARAEAGERRTMGALRLDQLSGICFGGALA